MECLCLSGRTQARAAELLGFIAVGDAGRKSVVSACFGRRTTMFPFKCHSCWRCLDLALKQPTRLAPDQRLPGGGANMVAQRLKGAFAAL